MVLTLEWCLVNVVIHVYDYANLKYYTPTSRCSIPKVEHTDLNSQRKSGELRSRTIAIKQRLSVVSSMGIDFVTKKYNQRFSVIVGIGSFGSRFTSPRILIILIA